MESRTQDSRPRPRTQKKSEAKAKNSLSEDRTSRGQGQECSRPRPRTKNTGASVLQKKKVFKNIFQAISNSLAYLEFLIGVSPALKLLGRRVFPTRFERWMIRRKTPNSSPNFGKKPLQFPAKTIFFCLYLILAKNTSILGEELFFLVFVQFRQQNYVIFPKVLSHAKCVWSRLQKRPPHAKFYNLSTG